jgi:hypothetical protein
MNKKSSCDFLAKNSSYSVWIGDLKEVKQSNRKIHNTTELQILLKKKSKIQYHTSLMKESE